MKTRRFQKLGIEVFPFGLGCMRFTEKTVDGKSVIDEEKAVALIRHAIDNGVNYLDTAYVYNNGDSERVLGKALLDGYRDKVYIATKLPVSRITEPEQMEEILNEELSRLHTDHIDFYLTHALTRETWDKAKKLGVKEFLLKKKAEGVIKYICFSFHDNLSAFKYIIDDFDWDMVQIQYNFMNEDYQAGNEGLKYAHSKGIPVVIMEGLLGGKLAKAPENVQALYDAFPVKRSQVEWSFRWLLNHKEVNVILSGCNEISQVDENIRIFESTDAGAMDDNETELMKKACMEYKKRTKADCTGCRYCMPCPNGVGIPEMFGVWNTYSLYGQKHMFTYNRLKENNALSDSCIGCGLCEDKCPQHLPISELMIRCSEELKDF